MSNKNWHSIDELDRVLRRAFPAGMYTGVKVKIEMINGFELFNTRPYHNYETWSDGYQVTIYSTETGKPIFWAESEDLDDAIVLAIKRAQCEHDHTPLVKGGKPALSCKKCGWIDSYLRNAT